MHYLVFFLIYLLFRMHVVNDQCVFVLFFFRNSSPLLKLYDDCVMERHYFSHFLMVTTGEVSKRRALGLMSPTGLMAPFLVRDCW